MRSTRQYFKLETVFGAGHSLRLRADGLLPALAHVGL